MSFVSPEFALLALLFFPLYWSLASRRDWQQKLLVFTGYGLYATWSIYFSAILLIYSSLVWALGRKLAPASKGAHRRLILTISLSLGVGFLAIVKYYEFARQLLQPVVTSLGFASHLPLMDVLAPAGVSFFTFQAISYWVGIYQAKLAPQAFARVHLFMSFWPTLFAGPIFRAEHFFVQLDSKEAGTPQKYTLAIYFMLLGLIQKLVFASWLSSTFVESVFKYPEQSGALAVASAMVAYSLQIFFDFAGYTLIVTGLGLLLGYQLPENFRQPYLAADVQVFWQRWHMSLSTFIRDYIYIPLGGNQNGFARAQLYLLVAMLISGLWHGASLCFIVWGLMHGLGVLWVRLRKHWGRPELPYWLATSCTLVFVAFAWVFFRASTITEALAVLRQLWPWGQAVVTTATAVQPSITSVLMLAALTVSLLWFSRRAATIERSVVAQMDTYPAWMLIGLIFFIVTLCLALGPSGVPGFIYYQF